MRRLGIRRACWPVVHVVVALLTALAALGGAAWSQNDPLRSWNDGPAKRSVVTFVQAVTDRTRARFVPSDQRIATFGDGARFMGLVRHTDAVREWAYDRQSRVGRLDRARDEAKRRGWTIVDMKTDWKKIFPFE